MWLRGQQRLIVDSKTKVLREEQIPVARLKPGTRLLAWGHREGGASLVVEYLEVTGPDSHETFHGVKDDGEACDGQSLQQDDLQIAASAGRAGRAGRAGHQTGPVFHSRFQIR